jgi:hypothetical protein
VDRLVLGTREKVLFGVLNTPLADVFQGSGESVEDVMHGSTIRMVYIVDIKLTLCPLLHQNHQTSIVLNCGVLSVFWSHHIALE